MRILPNIEKLLTQSFIIIFSVFSSFAIAAQNIPEQLRKELSETKGAEKARILLEIGTSFSRNSIDSAQWYANQALLMNKGLNSKTIEAKCMLLLGNIYYSKNQYDSSQVYVERAIKLARAINEQEIIASGLFQWGNLYLQTGNYSNADSCFNQAMLIQEKTGNKHGVISILSSMGNSFYRRGMFNDAIIKFEKVYEIANEVRDTAHITMSLNNIAAVNLSNSNYKDGIETMHKSLALAKIKKDNYAIAGTLLNMGQAYTNWEKYDDAITYLNESLLVIEKLKNPNFVAYYHMLIAYAYYKKGEFRNTIKNLETALPIAREFKNINTESRILNLLADSYTGLGQYELAVEHYKQSLSIREKIGNKTGLAEVLSSMGTCYSKWGKSAQAIKYLEESNEIATALNTIEIAMDNNKWLAIEYEKQNNIPKAYKHYKKYKTLEDSIFSENSDKQLSELQLKYETEKKENEILSLNEKNATQELEITRAKSHNRLYLIIGISLLLFLFLLLYFYRNISQKRQLLKKQNDELEELNKTKNHFFSVVAHDLKSHITAFQSTGKIVEHHIEQKNYDKAQQFASHIENESEKLNNMLSNLLKWSITQLHGYNIRPEKLMVRNELETIVSTFAGAAKSKNITLLNQVESEIEAWADKGSFHVVLRNLISNAIKYSADGEVLLTANTSDGFININVEDCGKGISPEIEEKLFEIGEEKIIKGTAGEQGTGLGLLLVKQFTQMNMGKVGFRNSDRGALFTVSLPVG